MGQEAIVLVDFENVQEIDFVSLGGARLTVFAGEGQKKVPIDLAMRLHALGHKARWVKASGAGPNALDFHIAFEIGRMVEAGETGPVILLSKDKGFDPLLAWLSADAGVPARRVSTLQEAFGISPQRHSATSSGAQAVPLRSTSSVGAAAPIRPALADPMQQSKSIPLAKTAPAKSGPSQVKGTAKQTSAAKKGAASKSNKRPSAERAREILCRSEKVARPRRRATLAKHITAMFQAYKLAEQEVDAIIEKLLANRLIAEKEGVISYNF